jgi:ubiquinol-cytochrome c reductase cytochrome c1 subunit
MVRLLRFACAALALATASLAQAASGTYPLQDADIDIDNLYALQRGARNFVNYCLGCHGAKYMRYSQVAEDLALTEDELRNNLMFTGEREFDPMESAMPAEDASRWFGNAPPDLSLIARSRGVDYVYTFLKSFYEDPSRPSGANNAVLPQTAMPNVLAALQGPQAPKFETKIKDGKKETHLVALERTAAGAMTAAEFDGFVRDTVTFLEYVAEPAKAERKALGVWVILFLLMFTAFTYFLKQEYWKDVK